MKKQHKKTVINTFILIGKNDKFYAKTEKKLYKENGYELCW